MRSKRRLCRRVLSLALLPAVVLWGAPLAASVLDAPHNETNAIACTTCHSYSMWWQYSPVFQDQGYSTVSDAVCGQCHASGGSAFTKVGHSAANMGHPHAVAGDWSTKCVDCHDPHLQPQLKWLPANPGFGDGSLAGGVFLAEGRMSGIVANGDGTTSFQFSEGLAKAGWEDAQGDWSAKSGHAGRGLLLVLGYGKAERTFEVEGVALTSAVPSSLPAVGAGTITVRTGNDTIPAAYENSPFGLFYGQLIKNSIQTPNSGSRSVRFLDGKSGLVTTSASPRDGVCQVCHTVTKYWRNDGDVDPATGLLHNASVTCTACHHSETGFKPSGGPHTFLGETPFCMTCHPSGDILALHKSDCQHCHTTPPTLADPATRPLVEDIRRGTCLDCHGAKAHPTATAHNNRQINATCAACHTLTDQAAVDSLHRGDCATCHGYSGTKLDASLVANAIASGKGANGSPIDCRTCHAAASVGAIHHATVKAINNDCTDCHSAVDHSPMVHDSATPVCTGCHTATAGTTSGITVNPLDPKVHYACRTCHTFDPDRRGILVDFTNRKGVNGSGSLPAGGGLCTDCHTEAAKDFHHLNPHVAVGDCEQCHIDPRPSRGHYQPGDNGSSSRYPTQLACRECHVRFVDGAMTVIKYSRTDYDDLSTPWTQTVQHTIPGVSQGWINNYGICFSCHGEGTATKVRVFHARPDQHDTNNSWQLGTRNWRRHDAPLGPDQAHYAAGRSSSGISAFNYFSASYEAGGGQGLPPGDRPPNPSALFDDYIQHYSSPRVRLYPYMSSWPTSWTFSIGAGSLNNWSSGTVIVLPALPSHTAASPTADVVKVVHAVYDGSDLTVIASNTDGCQSLTASYGAATLAMSGSELCTAIFFAADYPAAGGTVSVATANPNGVGVTGYPIADRPGAVAVSDFFAAYSGESKALAVLANDLGPGLSLQAASEAGHGAVTLSGDMVVYTSAPGYSGQDSFTYTVVDQNGVSSQATVTVTVTVNQAPVAVADDYTVPAGGAPVAFDVVANDTDTEGEALTVTAISTPAVGTAVLDGGRIRYTPPPAGFDGVTTLAYQIRDSFGNLASGEVTIHIITPRDWVTVLDPWPPSPQLSQRWVPTTVYANGYALLDGPSFTVSPGLNRLLVVAVTVDSSVTPSGNQDFVVASYGGKALTRAFVVQAATNYKTYLGYLKEADIAAASGNQLSLAVAGYDLISVSIASYGNVNQESPLSFSGGNSYVTSNSRYYAVDQTGSPMPIPVHAGQRALYAWHLSQCITRLSDSEGYGAGLDYTNEIDQHIGIAAKLFASDGYTDPRLTSAVNADMNAGGCYFNGEISWGSSALVVLNNVSGTSAVVDEDLDGVPDNVDQCLGTPPGQVVNSSGCENRGLIAFAADAYTVAENGITATITVSRSGSSVGEVQVHYATTYSGTANSSYDFVPTSGTLTWADGDTADKSFTVEITDNALYNDNKTVGLALDTPAGGAILGSRATALLNIIEDEQPPAVIALASATASVGENAGPALLTVKRSGNSVGSVMLYYESQPQAGATAIEDVDYQKAWGTLTWADGDLSDKTISLGIIDNTLYSADKTVTMNLLVGVFQGNAVLGSPTGLTLTIVNDDPFLDADGDGVQDVLDLCPNTPAGLSVDADGCALSQIDSDHDGVPDVVDQCPGTGPGQLVNAVGCPDSDQDGVADSQDLCPDTPFGQAVDAAGCAASQRDSDSDGVKDDVDLCPNTPAGQAVNAEGCALSQIDSDGDGVMDDVDACPHTPAGQTVDASGCSADQLLYRLPDSGQTTSYTVTFGEDHDYPLYPLSYAAAAGMVADQNSKLTWQQQDDGVKRTWSEAEAYCLGLGLGGHADWRLPTKQDLISILDLNRQRPAIDPLFAATQWSNAYYWSATSDDVDPTAWAWVLSFDRGRDYVFPKSSANYVRCVRGGQ